MSTPLHQIVLVHTKLDTFVCLCISLNVLGGVQNRWSTEQVEYRTGGVQNRWSTEQVEYRTGCCNAFLLYSAQKGLCNFYWLCFSCATYHITDVQKHMGTHWTVYCDVESHFPLLIVITFGNTVCTQSSLAA